MKIAIALIVMVLAGCAGLGQGNQSAEQLKALAADKSVGVMTNEITGIWGSLKSKIVTVDEKVLIDNHVTVGTDGTVTVTSNGRKDVPQANSTVLPVGTTLTPGVNGTWIITPRQ